MDRFNWNHKKEDGEETPQTPQEPAQTPAEQPAAQEPQPEGPQQPEEARQAENPAQNPQPQYYPPQGNYPPPQGYYPPPQGYYPPYPYPPQGYQQYQGKPPKKKLSTGAKVFIGLGAALACVAIVLCVSFFAYTVIGGRNFEDSPVFNDPALPTAEPSPGEATPYPSNPGGGDSDPGGEEEKPQLDSGITLPDMEKEIPAIDTTPNTEGIAIEKRPTGSTMQASDVYEKVVSSTVTVVTWVPNEEEESGFAPEGTGTGIFATEDGYIITNAHVVDDSRQTTVTVTTYDGKTHAAVVIGVDRATDLAVLKTSGTGYTPATFGDSDSLVIGDEVIAIGNPGGERFSASMTGGYISGLNRKVGKYSASGMTFIQTDAAINPGNSGGPLVNLYGQVVGINSSKIVSSGYEGMGFAIPSVGAVDIVNQLMAGGYVQGRTRLGIKGYEVTEDMQMMYGVPGGFAISEIDKDSSFAGTQAQAGDIITAIDGQEVSSLDDITSLLSNYSPGDKVVITLYRIEGNRERTLEVEVELLEDKGETVN